MIIWDPNNTIDIGEWSICGGGQIESFYCVLYIYIHIYITYKARLLWKYKQRCSSHSILSKYCYTSSVSSSFSHLAPPTSGQLPPTTLPPRFVGPFLLYIHTLLSTSDRWRCVQLFSADRVIGKLLVTPATRASASAVIRGRRALTNTICLEDTRCDVSAISVEDCLAGNTSAGCSPTLLTEHTVYLRRVSQLCSAKECRKHP